MVGRALFLLFLSVSVLVHAAETNPDQKIYTTATFGPDGRLWRVVPAQDTVSVDYSLDYGKTFSKPVRITPKPKPINFWDENPPSISVDNKGSVYVLYFADDKQHFTTYFSKSDDGIHFSQPVKVSSKANTNVHYQSEMLVDAANKIHILWHDDRDAADYKRHGGGDLSLYYVSTKLAKIPRFPHDHRLAKNICSCCRTAATLDVDGQPVILARFVYPGNIRDHGMLKVAADGTASKPWRVTFDDWKIEGCPTHGPALSISNDGRYHITWFTQGKRRTGLFYAWSDDQGKTFSEPVSIGNPAMLPGRADVLAMGKQVALAWKEFDGIKTRINVMHSIDGGNQWTAPKVAAETPVQSEHPALINDGKRIFLSWNSVDTGYRLIPIE